MKPGSKHSLSVKSRYRDDQLIKKKVINRMFEALSRYAPSQSRFDLVIRNDHQNYDGVLKVHSPIVDFVSRSSAPRVEQLVQRLKVDLNDQFMEWRRISTYQNSKTMEVANERSFKQGL